MDQGFVHSANDQRALVGEPAVADMSSISHQPSTTPSATLSAKLEMSLSSKRSILETNNLTILRELPDASVELFMREPDEFLFFLKLPLELQGMIWKRASPSNRKVHLIAYRYDNGTKIAFKSRTPQPAIFRTTKDSRREAMLHYKALLGSREPGTPFTLFNPVLDMVSIRTTDKSISNICWNHTSQLQGLYSYDAISPAMICKLRRVQSLELRDWDVIETPLNANDEVEEHFALSMLLMYLPSLETVKIILGSQARQQENFGHCAVKVFLSILGRLLETVMFERSYEIPCYNHPDISVRASKKLLHKAEVAFIEEHPIPEVRLPLRRLLELQWQQANLEFDIALLRSGVEEEDGDEDEEA